MRASTITALLICIVVAASCSPAVPSADSKRVIRVNYEFAAGLKRRGIQNDFNDYRLYVGDLLSKSRVAKSDSEKTGKCRLRWVEELVAEPLPAVSQAEQFTRELFVSVKERSLRKLLHLAGKKLDLKRMDGNSKMQAQAADPLDRILQITQRVRLDVEQAFRSLSTTEQQKLQEQLYSESTANTTQGYRFADKERAAELINFLERIDYSALMRASEEMTSLTEVGAVSSLPHTRKRAAGAYPHVRGELLDARTANSCTVLLGGPGNNSYSLDEMPEVCAVIDVGGDDAYVEGAVTASRRVLILVDLAGNDIYRGKNPGIQGGAIMGASMVWDLHGNDKYYANDIAQGSALAGIGILFDESGTDLYYGDRRVQGQALGGVGLLIDLAGSDDYRGALMAQGVGGTRGFGLLADAEGADHYFAGGKYRDSYEDSPGFGSWSQGLGIGIRGVADGGIGTLLDGAGNDVYEADYFSYGGGYWFGAGFARDFAGDDRRIGGTRVNFDGSRRTEERFLRWGIGFSCHYSAGFVFDDQGNDTYNGDWAVIAYSWDVGVAALCDFSGSDTYRSKGSGPAQARNVSLAILYDRSGKDIYSGEGLGEAEEESESHVNGQSRSSFAMLLDDSGEDVFPLPLRNHRDLWRSWAGGFFVDR